MPFPSHINVYERSSFIHVNIGICVCIADQSATLLTPLLDWFCVLGNERRHEENGGVRNSVIFKVITE